MIISFAVLIRGEFGNACSAILASERAALITLYHSTNGDNWSTNSRWQNPPQDDDGNIDGHDLAIYIADPAAVDVEKFPNNFGNTICLCADK